MRIGGTKPSSLADLVADLDKAENEGMVQPISPPESEPVITGNEKLVEFGDGSVTVPPPTAPEPAPPATPAPPSRRRARPAKTEKVEIQGQTSPMPEVPQIEKGVAIPDHGNVGRIKYPFKEMEIHDSFVIRQMPGETRKRLSARVRSAAAQYARRAKPKVTFTTRMEANGIRVWRMS